MDTEERHSLNIFSRDCTAVKEPPELWELALDFYHRNHIERVSYHINNPGPVGEGIATDGFPEDWVKYYIGNNLARIDPIPELAARLAKPFFWSEVRELMKVDETGNAYLKDLERANLGDGLAIQVFGPNLRNAYLGLGFGNKERPGLAAEDIFILQCAAQIAHIRYCDLTRDGYGPVSNLSPREIEVLRWMARGKSTSVIAEILGLSPYTIDTVTRRIFTKLKVNDRTNAVIRGLGSGLLRYENDEIL
jgi:LuxR family transcriptional regulator/LuxR family quorum-sensing system transcriptional regulator CciR